MKKTPIRIAANKNAQAHMDPQFVINELSKYTEMQYLAMDKSGHWYAWKRSPGVMPISQGWFAPGSHVKIADGILPKFSGKWSESLFTAESNLHN